MTNNSDIPESKKILNLFNFTSNLRESVSKLLGLAITEIQIGFVSHPDDVDKEILGLQYELDNIDLYKEHGLIALQICRDANPVFTAALTMWRHMNTSKKEFPVSQEDFPMTFDHCLKVALELYKTNNHKRSNQANNS